MYANKSLYFGKNLQHRSTCIVSVDEYYIATIVSSWKGYTEPRLLDCLWANVYITVYNEPL